MRVHTPGEPNSGPSQSLPFLRLPHSPTTARTPSRRRATIIGAATLMAVVTGAVALINAPAAMAGPGVPVLSPLNVPGRGATVPFKEVEAEYADTNGSLVGPTRFYGQLASEASGRQAITLDAVGEYVEFTLPIAANAMTMRYSLPDSANGAGRDATMDVRVNGSLLKTIPVTSKYSWYYGGYPFNNNPGDTNPHHFYDETRTMFGSTLAQGTKVRVQVNSTAQSPTFTIDLADFELVAGPIGKPTNAIDVVADFGADPSGATDSTAKFQSAVDAGKAQGRAVYIPQGNFTLYDHVVVDGVTLQGAGPWYSVLGGRDPVNRKRAAGIYGKYVNGGGYTGEIRSHEAGGPSQNVTLKDFAIIGDIRERVDEDQVNAIGGAFTNSVVDNVWMQHTKVGAWMDGPMNNFVIRNSRILDQTADAVNFHYGVSNSRVTNTFVRNSGDDGLAIWAQNVVSEANSFDHNTVVLPILANNIVAYGGRNTQINDNVVADTITNGGGIHIANRYPGVQGPTAVAGTVSVARNTLIRAGNSDFNWQFGVGAIWFDALNGPISGATINVTDTDILDSSYAAIHFIEGNTSGVNFNNVRIDGAGTYALQIQAPGAATFTNVTATRIAQSTPIHNCVGSGFQITQGAGNSGWYTATPFCGPWPAPNWGSTVTNPPTTTPPVTGPAISLSPASLSFGTQSIGQTSAAQAVTVTNTGNAAATLSGVTASGDFARTTTCGSSLAAGTSCTASVTFTPTAAGSRNGTLSVSSNAPGSPHTVSLAGVGADPNGNLAQGKVTSETSHSQVYASANAVDGNASTYWESANGAFPQSLTVDLGTAASVGRVVLKLPPTWGARTQTLSVLGSTDGASYSTVVGSAGYLFDPASGNTVTINFTPTSRRYLRLTFTANTGWPAGQVSEFEVYGQAGSPAPAVSLSTTAVTFGNQNVGSTSAGQTVTVTNTGTAAATLGAVTVSGDFARTTTCGATLAAGTSCSVAVTFTPTATGVRTGTLSLSSNAPLSPHTASLTGTGTTANSNLAAGKPTAQSSQADVYGSANVTDGNANSYWESANNAFPQWVQVDLGANTTFGRIVLKLPPSSSWGTRTETLTVAGSTNGSTFTTLVGSAGYTFNPATGNTVTITFTASSQRYVRLNITGNTGWPAGQVSEFEVYAS